MRTGSDAGQSPDPASVRRDRRGRRGSPRRRPAWSRRGHALASEVLGLGPLDACVADPRRHRRARQRRRLGLAGSRRRRAGAGGGWSSSRSAARRLAVRLAGLAGRRLDESQAWVDGLLPSGIRLHAILPPLVDGGAHVSLRVPRATGVRAGGPAAPRGCSTPRSRSCCGRWSCRRRSFVVTGGTGCGKTTLLAAMLAEVAAGERIVVVEDVRELAVAHPHVVRLQGRGRQRRRPRRRRAGGPRAPGPPDEAGPARGRRGAWRRGARDARGAQHRARRRLRHAAREHPRRRAPPVRRPGALAGLPRDAVQTQLASAVEVVVHLERGDGVRRVASLSVLRWTGSETVCDLALDVARDRAGPGWPAFAALVGVDP